MKNFKDILNALKKENAKLAKQERERSSLLKRAGYSKPKTTNAFKLSYSVFRYNLAITNDVDRLNELTENFSCLYDIYNNSKPCPLLTANDRLALTKAIKTTLDRR